MGCSSKARKSEARPKHSATCRCAQTFDKSFPYKELPPPEPPDGRTDLWELQFCRWWGWNWVRKRDDIREPPIKMMNSSDCSAKKVPITFESSSVNPKEQLKVICKCLMGKKRAPCQVAELYNTPSASVVAFKNVEAYGVGENKVQKRACKDFGGKCKKSVHKAPNVTSEESEASSAFVCKTNSTRTELSATEESVEYITVKLQPAQSNLSTCPCAQQPARELKDQMAATEQRHDTKETQTCVEENCEKLIKLKGKKHKTICITVCCCGSCKQSVNEPKLNQKERLQLPTALPVLTSTKPLSKFGTPSKSYPWMTNSLVTDSAMTTTSLSNLYDFYDKKRPDLEDRLLLDAVCDAILRENKTTSDVYTELSKILTEDASVQMSNKTEDVKTIDSVVSSIIGNNIFSESDEEITKCAYTKSLNDGGLFTKTGLLSSDNSSGIFRKRPKMFDMCSDSKKFKGTIFSKIDDIIDQSKAKTAQIQQKVLQGVNVRKNYTISSDFDENAFEDASSPKLSLHKFENTSSPKLSAHNFVVCDQKSSLAPPGGSGGVKFGSRKVKKKIYGRGSLIPIRK